jgi:hypothetical protein
MMILLVVIVVIYLIVGLLNHYNIRCPIGHKWHEWDLIENVDTSKYRICTRCKIEMKGSTYKNKIYWNKKITKGQYEKYKDIAPIPFKVVSDAIHKNRDKQGFTLFYKGKTVKLNNNQ